MNSLIRQLQRPANQLLLPPHQHHHHPTVPFPYFLFFYESNHPKKWIVPLTFYVLCASLRLRMRTETPIRAPYSFSIIYIPYFIMVATTNAYTIHIILFSLSLSVCVFVHHDDSNSKNRREKSKMELRAN